MCHSLANLEWHQFKYAQFRRPGDIHVHFFGTATLSFSDGFTTEAGRRVRNRGESVHAAASQPADPVERGTSRRCGSFR